jgi:N6-adenosine-specific RNA methylase IME4
MGQWFRGQVEECWLLKRGDARPFRSSVKNIIRSKPAGHSRKPEELFEMIEREADKAGLNNRLEIFARGVPRSGWKAAGDEVIK